MGNQEWTIKRHWQHWAHNRPIKNGQSRDTGNIGHTRHSTKTNTSHRKNPKTTQHRKLKRLATQIPLKTGDEPRCSRRVRSNSVLVAFLYPECALNPSLLVCILYILLSVKFTES